MPIRAGWLGPDPVAFWVSPGMEILPWTPDPMFD